MNAFFKGFCIISSIVSAIVCLAALSGVYLYVSLVPISFLVFVFFESLMPSIWQRRPLSLYIITFLLWMRMVLLPFYGSVVGFFSTSGASVELGKHFISSVSLCLYDCAAIIIVLLFLSSKKVRYTPFVSASKGLCGQSEIYLIFCAFAVFVYFAFGRSIHLFDFAIKPIGSGIERDGDITDGRSLIIRQVVGSGLMFLFLLAIYWLKKKHLSTNSNKYFYLSLVCAFLFIAIITGERRTSQLYKAFASGFVLLSLYPSNRRKTITLIGVFAFVILALMTIYKQFYGFLYDSYSEAIRNASMLQGFSYELLDAYFFGLDTVAKNIHYGQMMNTSLGQFLYDFFRNVFGISFFVPGGRMLTSQVYNSIIYSGEQFTGLLLSSVGYGYLFFGYVLAPFVTVFNVIMILFLEKCMKRAEAIEWQYVYAILFIRFAFGFLGSTPPLINLTTRFLVINALIIGMARIFKIKKVA